MVQVGNLGVILQHQVILHLFVNLLFIICVLWWILLSYLFAGTTVTQKTGDQHSWTQHEHDLCTDLSAVCRSPTEADAQAIRTAVLLDELDFPVSALSTFHFSCLVYVQVKMSTKDLQAQHKHPGH